MDSTSAPSSRRTPVPGPLVRAARRAVHAGLRRLERGCLTLVEDGVETRFGSPDDASGIKATVTIHDPRFHLLLLRHGSLGAGEAFMDGLWSCDDLASTVRILAVNEPALARLDGLTARLARPLRRVRHALRRNSRRGSQRNIADHYDLGNEFFALFLDPTLTYSCGIFERPDTSLEEASRAKYERICHKLALTPDDHVLEIGGGWGGFALHAAGRYGCRVTTTTISRAQYDLARRRIAEAGLADRVEILRRDYRDLEGTYDKLVSIEMIEAVGKEYFDAYFRTCSERLRPDGLMLLQAIVVPEERWEVSKRSVDFIKRYIFPGGCLISVGAIAASLGRVTDFRIVHLEDLSAHYARTLARWRERFLSQQDRVRQLGFPERFLRLWEFYLGLCEGGFAERYNGVVQMLLAKRLDRREPLLGALP